MEAQIDKYIPEGSIYVWKYTNGNNRYPGWNITADQEGCMAIIRLLKIMQQSPFPSSKLLTLEATTINQAKVIGSDKPVFQATSFLTLRYRKGEKTLWIMEESRNHLTISFGESEVALFQGAVFRVAKGKGDFAIGDRANQHLLYFWWLLKE